MRFLPNPPSDADDLLSCVEAALNDDFSRVPTGSDALSRAIAALIERSRGQTSAQLDDVVSVSVSVNETAGMSAHLLYDLRQVDDEAQGIAAAAEEMAATVNEVGPARRGNPAQCAPRRRDLQDQRTGPDRDQSAHDRHQQRARRDQ